jgi:hypothetical protein
MTFYHLIAEIPPAWTKKVPAIDIDSVADLPGNMLDSSGRLLLEKEGGNIVFAERNIITNTGCFRTV